MNESSENSLRQFERIEKQLTTALSTNGINNENSPQIDNFQITPNSIYRPLRVPNFKQTDLIPPPQLHFPDRQPFAIGNNNVGAGNRPFHSTPQQPTGNGKMFGQGGTKKSHNLSTPNANGKPISPIAEEGSEDLDRLVTEVGKLREQQGGEKVMQNLVKQLRDLIAQWDWAQARHRHVAKIYFEKQREELNAGWKNLQEEAVKFNQQKTEEWTKIAGIRSSLQNEKAKASAKKEAERIKELELELEKLKAKELMWSQKMSELRTKCKELEGEVNVRQKSYGEQMVKLRKVEERCVKTEQENSNLRTKMTLMREKQQNENAQSFLELQNAPKPQQSQPVGPRATLFNLYNSGARNRIASSSTSSSMGGGGTFSSTRTINEFAPKIRRNNSDNTFSVQNGNGGRMQMHRSNSANANGPQNIQQEQMALRPRVRFAEEFSEQPQREMASPPQFGLATAFSPIGGGDNANLEIGGDAINKRFDIPAKMENTMYQMTARGKEFTFSDGQKRIVAVELLGCQNPPFCRRCILHEYPTNETEKKDFRWISGPLMPMNNGKNEQIQVEYFHAEGVYELRTSTGNKIRYKLNGQLEVCWATGDRTLIMANGERREIFSNSAQSDLAMEIYIPTGIAYRLDSSTQWQKKEFVPDTERMAARPDGSYSSLIVQELDGVNGTINGGGTPLHQPISPDDLTSLQINAPDFTLRRFNGTRAAKVEMVEPGIPGGFLQLWLCVDNVLMVKHIQAVNTEGPENGRAGGKRKEKHICFSHGQCRHIKIANGNSGTNAIPPMVNLD